MDVRCWTFNPPPSIMLQPMRTRATALILAAVLCGCGKPRPPQAATAPPDAPNIIIVTIDTLRADHLSCHGYERPTTPFLDSLAARGCRFVNAYSTAPWTAPSMASLFTGLYPREHGILHGAVAGPQNIIHQEMLVDRFVTLPEALQAAGYRTFAVISNGHVSRETGFAQGFDGFNMLWFEKSPAPNNAAADISEQIAGARPFFFWIHYFDPHAPYFAREPWIRPYYDNEAAVARWEGTLMKQLRLRMNEIRRDPDAVPALQAMYDSELNYCDQYVKELFDMLPVDEDTLIVVSADHGEEFMEHGGVGHGDTLFDEVVHVPLIIVLPGGRAAGTTVEAPVSNKDIGATILEAAGIPPASTGLGGTSLLSLVEGGKKPPYDTVYLELDRGGNWKGLRRGPWKFICRGRRQKCALYNLESDPGEQAAVTKEQAELADQLYADLQGWMDAQPVFEAPPSRQALDEDRREQLRSLGYLK